MGKASSLRLLMLGALSCCLVLISGLNSPTAAQENAEEESDVTHTEDQPAALKHETFKTSYFEATLPKGWAVRSNDWDALASLNPLENPSNRAIDIYLEAIYVEERERRTFADQYASSLEPSGGGIIDPIDFDQLGDFDAAVIRLRKGADQTMFQEHWLLFHEQGVYIIVITSDDSSRHDDLLSALSIVASIATTPRSENLNIPADQKDMEKVLPSHWLGIRKGDTDTFHAPYLGRFDSDSFTTLRVTTNTTQLSEDERVSFVSAFTKEYALLDGQALNVQDTWSKGDDGSEVCSIVMTLPPLGSEDLNDPEESDDETPTRNEDHSPHWETTLHFLPNSTRIISLITVADRIDDVQISYQAMVEYILGQATR